MSNTQPPTAPQRTGLAIASLVLGILAIIGSFIPILNIGAIILGIIGAILGLVALLTHRPKGMSIAGLILSALAIIISIIMLVALGKAVDQVNTNLNKELTIEYTATVTSGEAKASWGTTGSSNESFTGTWTKSETAKGTDLAATLTITGDLASSEKQTLTCEIKVNGEVKTSQSGESLVTCSTPLLGK